MLPTLTIPSVAAPPRASEPANDPKAESESGDAFADALQRAQGEPRPAHDNEPRAKTSNNADAHARPARHAQTKAPVRESVEPPAGDAACSDAAAPTTASEPTASDAASRPAQAADGLPSPIAPPMAVDATAMAPQAIIEINRGARPRDGMSDADSKDPTLADDGRTTVGRAGSRVGGAHELRAGPSTPGRAAPQDDVASGRDNSAALPPHAAIERPADDAAAAPVSSPRAPTFERQPLDASATPLSATLLAREASAAAAAPAHTESKLPQATLHASIDEPGFGAAVGSQVALWVRDGVQEARLQLHPAELGPVTVQIALVGQAAHVDFTAAVAATRESIEQSLPALAAALRESGFTLAGGGVSSHAGQGGSDGRRERAGHGNRSRADTGVDVGPAMSAPPRWTRSLLDVYA